MRAPLDALGGSILPHILLPFSQILALALPPFRGRAALFVPVICGLVYATWTNLFTTNPFGRAALIAQWPVGALNLVESRKLRSMVVVPRHYS